RRPPHLRPASSVDHHGRVDVAEDARAHEPHLAGPALLGGRADHLDASGERQGAQRPQCGARARAPPRGGGVAARVADRRKRVVLGHDRDRRPRTGALDRGPEGRGQAADASLDPGTVLLQELREPAVRLLLLEAELRMVVDPMRERLEVVGQPVDGGRGLPLQIAGRAHFVLLNSSWARFTRPGSDKRSSVVIAIAFAAVRVPVRASGLTAAASKAREWIGVLSGAIFISGWMVGITWLTLPTSDEPSRSTSGGASTTPSAVRLAR